MGENNIDKNKLLDAIVNSSGSKINKNAVSRAKKGDISALLSGLNEQDRKTLNEALADKSKAREILASKQAKEIMKRRVDPSFSFSLNIPP